MDRAAGVPLGCNLMSAKPAVNALLKEHAVPLMKLHGFTKKGLTFTRQRGDVLQIVNVQISQGGAAFYLNVGLVVGALADLSTDDVKIGTFDVHHGGRIKDFVKSAPAQFNAVAASGALVARALKALIVRLEPLDGAEALLEHLDLSRGFAKVTRAKLAYALGHKRRAKADLKAVAKEFAARDLSVEWLAEQAGMTF